MCVPLCVTFVWSYWQLHSVQHTVRQAVLTHIYTHTAHQQPTCSSCCTICTSWSCCCDSASILKYACLSWPCAVDSASSSSPLDSMMAFWLAVSSSSCWWWRVWVSVGELW